ncbi:thioesterase [Oleomonas cavernae]|uniref:Thioesterase n=1 Tax=Oleomonas cavernae TaxID=2320859 RepID=A0A418W8F1_9PROT|nr:thioesterase family protein [Oleomonas cavernae]RJF86283.1 thioesterase [Oleomonas cavernae]
MSKPGFQTTWRGATDAWECDQMGHMNVQFYGRKFDESQAVMMTRLGLPLASAIAPRPLTDQIVFKRESRSGAVLHTQTAVIGLDRAAGTIRLRHEMYQSASDTLAAVLDTVMGGADAQTGALCPLPAGVLDAAAALLVAPNAVNAPAQPELPGPAGGVSGRAAADFGLKETLVSLVRPGDLAAGGLLTRQAYISRLSQAVGHLIASDAISAEALRARHIGSAALDYKVRWLAPSRPGDIVVLRSGSSGIVGRTLRLFHWLFDEASGTPLATVEIVAVYFDMQARKAIEVPDEIRALMAGQTAAWPG